MGLAAEASSLRADVESQKSARQFLSKKLHVIGQKVRCIPDRLETAATKATAKAKDEITHLFSFSLKEKGGVPDSTRDMITDLVALDGVCPSKVVGVLKRIAEKLGIAVSGDISDRTVRRAVKEGGVASQMQFVEAVGTSKGVTASSDGTTHKNINLESRRATVINEDNSKQTFFLGIGMAINHTSEKQLEGWEELIEAAYQKLFRLVASMKTRLEREHRGERTIAQMPPAQWADILFKISQAAVAEAGGITAWELLEDPDRLHHHDAAFTAFIRELGEEEFSKLTAEEKQSIDLFIWGGCCMHKNLNGSHALNHMELNVQRGLSCSATRHEFVVISLLNQCVDVPYMLEVRGPLRTQDNLLRLGPLHKKVHAHLEKIAANPKLITGVDVSFEASTLDGKVWQQPE
ncbi:hypothetical protein C8R46DRAFT_892312, partial [Mycena filopes]